MSKQEVENNTATEEEKVSEESLFSTKIMTMTSQFEDLLKIVKSLSNDLKTIKKEYSKLDKKAVALEKSKGRKRRNKEARENNEGDKKSSFHKPAKISEELYKFLNLAEGEEVSRPKVTILISNYVKEHDLKKEGDGRKIDMTKPGGEVLAKLLNIPTNTELTFFSLQTYLKPHYIVEPKVEKVATVVETEAEVEPKVEKVVEGEDVKPRRRRHVEATA
jgi:chromatin remodeling complex protein RSC6